VLILNFKIDIITLTKDHSFQIHQLVNQNAKTTETFTESFTTLSDVNKRLSLLESKHEDLANKKTTDGKVAVNEKRVTS
jgi:hypothetical protein